MKIVSLNSTPNKNLVEELQTLIMKAEQGEIDNLVCAFTTREDYGFLYHSNHEKALVLSSLLQSKCLDRFKV
jgi:hypothetical protein